jgi:predicted Zn-dependent protease with MMP-like domain
MSHQGNLDAPFAHLLRLAEEELQALKSSLPHPIRSRLDSVAILLEDLPSPDQIHDGIEDNQLGLFEGAPAGDADFHQPPRIILWLGNHWDMCGADEQEFRDEVRTTLLHEVGHFLGLDEAQIDERGLG